MSTFDPKRNRLLDRHTVLLTIHSAGTRYGAMAKPQVERRLAAILAADVAGYSRLMGADEEGTHARLNEHLSALLYPEIEQHGGRIIRSAGDGMLVEFASVVNAMRCAVAIQRGMIASGAGAQR